MGTPSLAPGRTARRNDSVVTQRVRDDIVLVHLDTNRIFNLNGTAARLWELLDAHAGVHALIDALMHEYDVERELLAADVDRTLAYFEQHDLVRIDPTP